MTIDIACIGQTKASGSVCRIVKHIGSGLINGNHSGISGGVSLFLANIELQSFKFIFTHNRDLLYMEYMKCGQFKRNQKCRL